MNTTKTLEFFNADELTAPISIIGCGAIGSSITELLVRMGCTNIKLYDFDIVASHNIANEKFIDSDIGQAKVDAVEAYAKAINPSVHITKYYEGLQEPYYVTGYVYLCVDNIELRKRIVEANKYNRNIKMMIDCRMRLTDAQCYFADWWDIDSINMLSSTMDFTQEEATAATPKSACGTELSVCYTVQAISCIAARNLVSFVHGNYVQPVTIIDMNELCIGGV